MADPAELGALVEGLSNADIVWDATLAGLTPTLGSPGSGRLLQLGRPAARRLVAAMSDPDRFVAAHVILTLASGMPTSTFPDWNGLVVEIDADGQVRIDPEQRFAMARRWQRWYEAGA